VRLWSLHPKYLDTKALLAVWREGLLAQKVLQGKTEGYTKHPQLIRFKNAKDPLLAIGYYLYFICCEAKARGYNFNKKRICSIVSKNIAPIKVSRGQLMFEYVHLLKKLRKRDKNMYLLLRGNKKIVSHPLFKVTSGGIADWEKV